MSLTENALPRFRNGFKRRHGLAEVVEQGGGVAEERHRVNPPHLEREYMPFSENASRHGDRFAEQRLGFFDALKTNKERSVVVGRSDGCDVFLAIEFQTS